MNETPRTNAEIRRWYLEQVARIPELNRQWVVQGMPARKRAWAAWRIRCEARLNARAMMADSLEVELLRQRDIAQYGSPDGPTFRYLVKKLKKEGLEGNDLYEAIVEFVSSTNAGVNRRLGI